MKTCPKIHNGILLWRLGHAAVLRSDLVAPELIGGTMPFTFFYECRQTASQTSRCVVVNLQIDHVSTVCIAGIQWFYLDVCQNST